MADARDLSDRWEKLSEEKKALLARRVAGASARLQGEDRIPRRSGAGPARLSFSQQRLWLLDRLSPGGVSYNVPYAYELLGELHLEALRNALAEIVRRHEILRTTFRSEGDTPAAYAAGAAVPTLELDAITGADEESRDREIRARARAHARAEFDLRTGPLMRVALLRVDATRHVLLLNFHHIVFDGWSESIFFGELRELYAAFAAGRPSPLPPLDIQYADYAEWQRTLMEGDEFRKQLSYWRARLEGTPPLLELPADRKRPSRQSFRGVTRLFTFPRDIQEGLMRLSTAEGATLFMTVLAAFNVFLMRYAGRTDIILGAPMAGRTRRDVEPLIGFFVNTLALRTDLSGDPTFRELLQRTKETALGAYENQGVPFERIVEELRPDRDLAYGPLIQVLLVLQTASGGDPVLPGVTVTRLPRDTDSAKFDLTLSLTVRSGGLDGWLEGNADIFEKSTVHRMVDHFEVLLRGVVADPGVRVSGLPLLPEGEQKLLLEEWSQGRGEYPRGAGIVRVFSGEALAHGESVALECGPLQMSYGELDRRSSQCARYLVRRGVLPGAVVGLALDRSLEVIVGMLGILKAGGAYCPLEVSQPEARLRYMMEEARIATVVTVRSAASRFAAPGVTVVCLDEASGEMAREEETGPSVEVTGESLAYAMYTSGSTGRPKCVAVVHDAVVRLVRGQSYVALGPEEVLLQYAPVSFDASTFEIWGALLNGGKLVIMPAGRYSLEEVGSVVRSSGVTTLWLTAALFHHMVDGPLELFGGLHQLLSGGDVLGVGHVQKFARRYPSCRVINGYGPTENTTFTCCYTVQEAEGLGATVPIGRPIGNTYVYVLDEHRRPVPLGVPGELYIGGDGLARGYLQEPELTEEHFVADPFAPGKRLYRSGDRVRYLADGNIEFLGRIDAQVKIRGYRIEPGEIEAVLAEAPGVRESLVLAREDVPGEKRLVAYLRAQPGTTEETLAEHLRKSLPDYMIPAAWVMLEAFPVTPNGKIDKHALPAPEGRRKSREVPETPTEKAVAQIWARLLPGGEVDMRKNFFEQGGHSLLAMQLVSRIQQAFQIEIPLAALFENPTISSLALLIEEKLTDELEGGDAAPAGETP